MTTAIRYAYELGMQAGDEQLALLGEAGLFWMRLGRMDEAARVFQGIDALAPLDACGPMGLTEVFLRQGRFEEAALSANKALQRSNTSPDTGRYLYLLLGEAEFACGNYAQSEQAWQTAIDLASESSEADLARRFLAGARELQARLAKA